MAAKSDGVLKTKKSDVAFTPLQNSEHCGSAQGLHPGCRPDSACTGDGDGDFANGESRCCAKSARVRSGDEPQKYSVWDCLWIVAAVAVYAADVGTDVWLSVDYYLHRDYWWFGLTLVFVVLGSFSVQLFSFRWFVHDLGAESAADAKKLLSGSASHGDVNAQHPPTAAMGSRARKRSASSSSSSSASASSSFSFCMCFCQSLIHILQLGQIWR